MTLVIGEPGALRDAVVGALEAGGEVALTTIDDDDLVSAACGRAADRGEDMIAPDAREEETMASEAEAEGEVWVRKPRCNRVRLGRNHGRNRMNTFRTREQL
jgi:hypothetical protein